MWTTIEILLIIILLMGIGVLGRYIYKSTKIKPILLIGVISIVGIIFLSIWALANNHSISYPSYSSDNTTGHYRVTPRK